MPAYRRHCRETGDVLNIAFGRVLPGLMKKVLWANTVSKGATTVRIAVLASGRPPALAGHSGAKYFDGVAVPTVPVPNLVFS